MDEKVKKRIPEPDVAKAFALFAVILQHAGLDDGNAFFFMSAFQVPLFFALSAAFIGDRLKSRDGLSRRIMRLFVPYICFSFLDTLMSLFVAFVKSGAFDLNELLRCLSLFFSGFGISVTWFLSALMLTELVFSLWLRAGKLFRLITALAVFASFFIINNFGSLLIVWYADSAAANNIPSFFLCCLVSAIARLPLCLIVYGISYFIAPRLKKIKPGVPLTVLLTPLFLGICFVISIINGGGSMGMVYYGFIPVLYLLSIFFGCIGILLLARIICLLKLGRPLAFIGANSLLILLTHMDLYLLSPSILIASKLCGRREGVYFLLLTLIITLLEELPLILIVNRFFPALTGRIGFRKKSVPLAER